MMAVRWPTNRSRTRCSACRSSWSLVLVATNLIVGRCTASAIASASRKSFFCPLLYGRTYFDGISRAKRLELATEMMRSDAGLHADQAGRQVREPRLHLAARPLLPQHDFATLVLPYDVE